MNMLRPDPPRFPANVFNIGDRVKCTNPGSKHYAHTAHIVGMGKTWLNVEFENGHNGKFIDWRDAKLVSPLAAPIASTATDTVSPPSRNVEENDDIEQLSNLLEHMAFTAATVISSKHGDPGQMTRLLDSFDRAVREHTNTIAGSLNRDNQHASPTRRNKADPIPP
jgi:hypothetical protein